MIILAGLIAGALLFFVSYRLTLRQVPIKIMDIAEKRMLSNRVGEANSFRHGQPPNHKTQQIVMPSPDLIYSACVYDLSAGDLSISGTLPPDGHYWSLSLYAHNTDNFFVLNDRELPSRSFSVVVRRKGRGGAPSAAVAESPTQTGIALIRMILRRPEDLLLIKASQHSIRCDILKA